MDNLFIMQIFQTHENTSHKEPCLFLIESSLTPNVVTQVPAAQIIHHHVQIISVLKCINPLYQSRNEKQTDFLISIGVGVVCLY